MCKCSSLYVLPFLHSIHGVLYFYFAPLFCSATWRTSAGMAATSTWSCCGGSSARPLSLRAMAASAAQKFPSSTAAACVQSLQSAVPRRTASEPASLESSLAPRLPETARRAMTFEITSMRTATLRWRLKPHPQRPAAHWARQPRSVQALVTLWR